LEYAKEGIRDSEHSVYQNSWEHSERVYEPEEGEVIKEMACGDRSGNIEFETGIQDKAPGFNWKEWKHYRQKVYWSIIGYNIRVMTAALMAASLQTDTV
jgi:hypothetical protein